MDRVPDIAGLLPHTGSMVMPESIEHCDDARIVCTSMRHRARDNPLRRNDRLPALCGVEFAAQAMALHGAMRRVPPAALQHGRVVTVRDVVVLQRFLDDVQGALVIECRLEAAAGDVFSYDFRIDGDGQPLLRGRATVMMSP
ncbi:MAG: 3-hydroxylacyl-ACP dehydratase [Betaproteobacteria bacterium]